MIITKPRAWERVVTNLDEVGARRVFVVGCGQCAAVAKTGGQEQVRAAVDRLASLGYDVTGQVVAEVTCHVAGARLEVRRNDRAIAAADAVLVLACGAGVQAVADATDRPVFPGLESAFLGTVVRHGVFEERCQMCGECVLDVTGRRLPGDDVPQGVAQRAVRRHVERQVRGCR